MYALSGHRRQLDQKKCLSSCQFIDLNTKHQYDQYSILILWTIHFMIKIILTLGKGVNKTLCAPSPSALDAPRRTRVHA